MAARSTTELDDAERMLLIVGLEKERRGFWLADDFVSEATERSAACGDEVTVRIGADGVVSWQGHGCTVSMAAASALGGCTADEVLAIAPAYLASVEPGGELAGGDPDARADLEPFVGIGAFPLRARCATLAWRAAVSAIRAV